MFLLEIFSKNSIFFYNMGKISITNAYVLQLSFSINFHDNLLVIEWEEREFSIL